MSRAPVLMVQGASSSVGKSWLATALCRIYARQGLRVAPFKAQNMSNNAAVCPDGGEIGRAQALQAQAAGVAPRVEMNPILLKPEGNRRSQVVVLGRPWGRLSAGAYHCRKGELWSVVTDALDRLRAEHDLVIAEGAGSPAELNLKPGDLVNMAVAHHADATVLLVGDIDRGGVFAQLLGTLWLLPPEEQRLVRALVVNKFRGDPALFVDGVRILEERGGRPVLGVVPYVPDLLLPREDGASLPEATAPAPAEMLVIGVIHLPRLANFDDVDPLRAEPDVQVRFVARPEELAQVDAILLPGSKHTAADLAWLEAQGLAEAIRERARAGVPVVGLCGGYQMLGRSIRDPLGVETDRVEVPGLGLLPVETTFQAEKATYQVRAQIHRGAPWLSSLEHTWVEGYEIHMGQTASPTPWLTIRSRNGQPVQVADGAMSEDGRIWGCYLHGIFANDGLRRAWLDAVRHWRAVPVHRVARPVSMEERLRQDLERWADTVEAALDMARLDAMIWE